FLLCSLLAIAIVANANQCPPKKSNPQNEQCAKDLMKDGIGSLPADLQKQLMEPLARKFADKLAKDMMDGMDDCDPNPNASCGGPGSSLGEIAAPSSEEGKKMFEDAAKDLKKNADELAKDVSGKLDDIGKDITEQVRKNLGGDLKIPEEFKDLEGLKGKAGEMLNSDSLGEAEKAAKELQDNVIGQVSNALDDALGGVKDEIGNALNGGLIGEGICAEKELEGMKKKVTEMPKGALDFLNKQMKEQTGDLAKDTLGPLQGELTGLVDGFMGGMEAPVDVKKIQGKMGWLKGKLAAVTGKYSKQFGAGLTAITGSVFGGFMATIPDEYKKEEEIISIADLLMIPVHMMEALNQTETDGATEIDNYYFNGTTYSTPVFPESSKNTTS
ncbi:hypothetical protein PFISCL1PPCAC_26462, partial [Pristionchus fissidentatus]